MIVHAHSLYIDMYACIHLCKCAYTMYIDMCAKMTEGPMKRERVIEDDKERTRQVQNEVNRLSNISKNREKAVLHNDKTWNVGEKTAKARGRSSTRKHLSFILLIRNKWTWLLYFYC